MGLSRFPLEHRLVDEEIRTDVALQVTEFVDREPVVERRDDDAELAGGEEEVEELDGVSEQPADPVALAHPAPFERRSSSP